MQVDGSQCNLTTSDDPNKDRLEQQCHRENGRVEEESKEEGRETQAAEVPTRDGGAAPNQEVPEEYRASDKEVAVSTPRSGGDV